MKKYLKYFTLLVLLITFLGFFATKIWDMDFWWHIASGKFIVESLSLPDKDPFSVYTVTGPQSATVLKAQWLGQVILFLVFNTFGSDGIILFKASVLTICLLIIYLRSTSLGSNPAYTIIVVFLSGMTALNFTGERPQLLSFLFASVVFLLLDNFKITNRTFWIYSIPIVILLWANSHGGVVLGSVLLLLYVIGDTIEWKLNTNRNQIKKSFLIFIGISIVLTLITPSGISKYVYVLQGQGSELQKRTSEYISPIISLKYSANILLYYWVFLLITVFALYQLVKDREIHKSIIVCVLAIISLTAFRYIPFFLFIASPYIALAISKLFKNIKLNQTLINIIVISISILVLISGIHSGKVFHRGINDTKFPEDAVNFIKQNGIKGKMFNSMNWGGYILWYLYPDVPIFIDGRAIIDQNKIIQYTHILWTTSEGLEVFNKEHFDLVLIPYSSGFGGDIYELNRYLLNNPQWQVIYQDKQGYLFGRRQ